MISRPGHAVNWVHELDKISTQLFNIYFMSKIIFFEKYSKPLDSLQRALFQIVFNLIMSHIAYKLFEIVPNIINTCSLKSDQMLSAVQLKYKLVMCYSNY